jgi:predicted nuclease of predicted toxin-antitoxin system
VHFLIDAQLPQSLTKFLTAVGHKAEHVADIQLLAAPDQEIWAYAKAANAIIITKDSDFAALTTLSDKPQVVWIRFGNTRKAALEKQLRAALPLIVSALQDGDRLVEVA